MSRAAPRAAVALIIFNRPAATRRVFATIAAARPPRLLVVADGPRRDHPDDPDLVRETRQVIEGVDWPCEVLTNYSSENLGCRRRVATGLDWVFSEVDEAIILEDDCLPDITFFRFCEELLNRYREVPRVQMVSGCNPIHPRRFTDESYYFSRCYHIWGWATWSRAWAVYDVDMTNWPDVRETDQLERYLGNETAARISRILFDRTYEGLDTWDFQWVLQSWLAGGLSITPAVNLVTNIGFGTAATHERSPEHGFANLPTEPIAFPLSHPPELTVLEAADRAEWEFVYPAFFQPKPADLRSRLRKRLGFAPPAVREP